LVLWVAGESPRLLALHVGDELDQTAVADSLDQGPLRRRHARILDARLLDEPPDGARLGV
jgi:hypothetical protein